jgi:replicative DNA helicase
VDSAQPQNLEAEEHVLGAMMLSPLAIVAVSAIVNAADFFRDSHGRIYRAALELWGAGTPVDAITLTQELEQRGELDQVGGRVRLHELSLIVPASANAAHYAQIVRDNSLLRGLIRAGGEIAQLGWDREGEPADLMARAEELMDQLRAGVQGERDQIMSTWDAALYLDEKFNNPPDESAGIRGPWSFVPKMMGGRLYVLAGYTADGKTAAAAQFFDAAVADEVRSDFLTLEMSKEDLAERLASTMGLPAKRVQSGVLLEEHLPIRRAVTERLMRGAKIGRIWDSPGADLATIRAHVKASRPADGGPYLLVVDHLHQFTLRAEYERQDLEAVVQGLWRIARDFDITILLLAQLSRSGNKQHPFPVPSLSALKGSAAIEQLAWAVWFVYRERDENHLATDDGLFIVAKNRSGPTGTRKLLFHPRTVRYTEVQHV